MRWPTASAGRTTGLGSLGSMPLVLLVAVAATLGWVRDTSSISIKPADFDRYIMPCYLGGASLSSASASASQQLSAQYNSNLNNNGYSQQQQQQQQPAPAYYGGDQSQSHYGYNASLSLSSSPAANRRELDRFSNLGQQIPRANSMDNFVALVSKIESANPRLANNPDQLVRMLLGRFRMDNYYYDVRNRVPISGEQDPRTRDIIPALLGGQSVGGSGGGQFALGGPGSDVFPEQLLDHDEKCSMYFMLSHFIDKTMPLNQPLASSQPPQLAGGIDRPPLRPPFLQAAGSGYPSLSANSAGFGTGSGGGVGGVGVGVGLGGGAPRYPGPSAGFGSQATNGMYSFGSGLSNQPESTGNNPLGQNVLRDNPVYQQQQLPPNYNSPLRNTGPYSGAQQQQQSAGRYGTPFLDGQGRARDDRQAIEYGVVTVGSQENAALVLNRVLMGILAATTPPQTIRQLAAILYPIQQPTITPKIDEEIDPLFALTLADLWAISSIPKSGKVFDFRLGDNGHWNDTMCPTSFVLERANSIRFTTAELIGGLDGFALGMFRRRMISMRKNIRLSELLRMYYSRAGFRPQFAEVSVCNRASALSTQMDDLRRQTENYLRLYQLNLPVTDEQISSSIQRLESFRDLVRQVSNQYAPQEICQDSSSADLGVGDSVSYATRSAGQEQCEIAKADVVTVLDTSMQANEMFMNLVVNRLAQKLGLSRQGNTFSVLTNQQDTTGYAGAYSFNAIVRNSSNTAEIGCALVHDSSRSYQGGQINDPTRLMEMFERALINLDTEYLMRQMQMGGPQSSSYSSSSSSDRRPSYISSLFGGGGGSGGLIDSMGPKNTGGSKVIIWFNYGSQPRMAPLSSGQTNWYPNLGGNSGAGSSSSEQNQYKLGEAKKYLRENFRGASILAVASNKDDAKAFVFDETRDIFTDIPQGSGSASSGDSYYPASQWDPSAMSSLMGPADQLVNRLLARMCDIPAVFQYPMCFRIPSENVASLGYITPGKKQYWMMSPKTFFASRSVRMAFRVEGGRLRVCFGRMSKPDESASRSDSQYQSGSISFGNPASGSSNQITSGASSSSSGNYYTGLSNGICKDVSPGQEVDFVVDDPCYKKSIAECEPFYFVIKEISNPGEGDPNYMCKDEGCKRFDQVKFIMTHTGVICSSAFKTAVSSWLLLIVSIVTALGISSETRSLFRATSAKIITTVVLVFYVTLQQVQAQQAGVYDFGQGRYGEKRGNFTPSEVLAIILLVMTILAGLALTIGLCYYVTKRNSRGMTRVEQNDY